MKKLFFCSFYLFSSPLHYSQPKILNKLMYCPRSTKEKQIKKKTTFSFDLRVWFCLTGVSWLRFRSVCCGTGLLGFVMVSLLRCVDAGRIVVSRLCMVSWLVHRFGNRIVPGCCRSGCDCVTDELRVLGRDVWFAVVNGLCEFDFAGCVNVDILMCWNCWLLVEFFVGEFGRCCYGCVVVRRRWYGCGSAWFVRPTWLAGLNLCCATLCVYACRF